MYDNIPSFLTGSYSLYKQLAVILRCNTDDMMQKFVNVQRQVGTADCGVFASPLFLHMHFALVSIHTQSVLTSTPVVPIC